MVYTLGLLLWFIPYGCCGGLYLRVVVVVYTLGLLSQSVMRNPGRVDGVWGEAGPKKSR